MHREGNYALFLANPEVVGFTTTMVNKDNNDTDTRTWNADSVSLPEGDWSYATMQSAGRKYV